MSVDIVALIELATSVESEAPLLAPALALTPYETALLLRAPPPVPLLRTPDRARALELLVSLRARGHQAAACAESAVASSSEMLHVRSFQLMPDALEVASESGAAGRLPWTDVVALVRGVHRLRTEQRETTTGRKLDLGRAALSGGLMVTKKVTTTTVAASEEREQVLYVFRRDGRPWLLRQSHLRYDGLRRDLRPSQLENFGSLIDRLRERAPHAPFDDRLLAPRPTRERVRAGVNGARSTSSADGTDLLAHLVAMAIARG